MMNSVCYWFPNNQVIASSRFFLFHSWWLTMWQIDLWLYDVWTSKHWHQVSFLFCLSKFCIDCRFFLWIIWLILMLQSEIWPVFLSMFVYVCINFRESKFKHQHWHFGKNNNKIISHPFVKTTTKTKTTTIDEKHHYHHSLFIKYNGVFVYVCNIYWIELYLIVF